MKILLLFAFLLTSVGALGAEGDVFWPMREGTSNYVHAKAVKKAQKKLSRHKNAILLKAKELLLEVENDFSSADYRDFFNPLEDLYSSLLKRKAKTEKQKKKLHLYTLSLLRSEELIDDTLFRLMSDYVSWIYPEVRSENDAEVLPPALKFSEYMVKKKALLRGFKKLAKDPSETVDKESPNPFPLKNHKFDVNGHFRLSGQDRIFYLYTPSQIKEMALIMDFALNVADAKKVTTTIEFRGTSESLVLTHSPTDQYRLALRLMRMKKEEAELDPSRLGVPVKDIDLILSAYAMGVLSYDELALIVKNPDFYVPEVSMAKKVAKYVGELTLLGLKVYPATAPYVIVPMIMYNAYAETKKAQNRIDEDSFIFTLPERGGK